MQQLLFLYLDAPSLHSRVLAWSEYSGAQRYYVTSADETPPYVIAVDALRDGWRLIQATGQCDCKRVEDTSTLPNEYIFERFIGGDA